MACKYKTTSCKSARPIPKKYREKTTITTKNTIIGNTVLYGATSGKLYASGQAGERFAVRNSGSFAIIEGCGAHGCEYMTGGNAIILGAVGDNFGAGMTGGSAYVFDEDRSFVDKCNKDLVSFNRITSQEMEAHRSYLKDRINDFIRETDSSIGKKLLAISIT